MSSQKSSRISCAAIMFSSRMMCSTCSSVSSSSRLISQEPKPVATPPGALNRQAREPRSTYPDPRSGLLPRLEKLGDVPPHLAELQLPPVPQQLDPRDRQLQQRLAAPRPPAHSAREPNQNWNHTNRTDNQSSTRNPPPQKRRNPARTYHLAPRKPPPPPPLKKASSIDMAPGEGWGAVVWEAAALSEARERRGDLRVGGSI